MHYGGGRGEYPSSLRLLNRCSAAAVGFPACSIRAGSDWLSQLKNVPVRADYRGEQNHFFTRWTIAWTRSTYRDTRQVPAEKTRICSRFHGVVMRFSPWLSWLS